MKTQNNIASESNSKNSLPTFLSLLCKKEINENTGNTVCYLFQEIINDDWNMKTVAYNKDFNSEEYDEHEIIITRNKKVIEALLDDESSFLQGNVYLTKSGNFSKY